MHQAMWMCFTNGTFRSKHGEGQKLQAQNPNMSIARVTYLLGESSATHSGPGHGTVAV